MRKWNRDRSRRRGPKPAASEEEAQPLQPETSEGSPELDVSPADDEGAEDRPEADVQASAAATTARPARSRTRRRKRKPSGSPAPAPGEPLIPAYSSTEGPRAPSPIALNPGAPTGEAGELDVPVAPAPAAAPEPPVPQPAAPKRATKGAVVLSVGLPGSGKTTWFKRKGVTPLSSDLLRTLLFDDPTEQRHQDLVFSSLRSLLRARMIARMPANYVDATNLSPKERRHWIRMAREFGYEVHAVYFDVPLATCLERNRKRQRIVPEDVMQRMAAKLRPPTFEEGFSKIIVVRVKHRAAGEEIDAAAAGEEPASESSSADMVQPEMVAPVPEAAHEPAVEPEGAEGGEPDSEPQE